MPDPTTTRKRKTAAIATRRPAETGGVAGYLALLIAHAAGLNDPTLIIALAGVVGFLPAAITWLVTLIRG